jgi:hypothetical protein
MGWEMELRVSLIRRSREPGTHTRNAGQGCRHVAVTRHETAGGRVRGWLPGSRQVSPATATPAEPHMTLQAAWLRDAEGVLSYRGPRRTLMDASLYARSTLCTMHHRPLMKSALFYCETCSVGAAYPAVTNCYRAVPRTLRSPHGHPVNSRNTCLVTLLRATNYCDKSCRPLVGTQP